MTIPPMPLSRLIRAAERRIINKRNARYMLRESFAAAFNLGYAERDKMKRVRRIIT